MGISYKKLWKLMIDRDLIKKDLREGCGLSTVSMAKLAKNRDVSTEILTRVCNFLRCDISDICEIILDDRDSTRE
jgi:DNA-binding Xre family transcriptional regulator